MATIYLAHEYFAPTVEQMQQNRTNAAKWGIWIAQTFGVGVSADWLWWTEFLSETPENRELGLRADAQCIASCNEFWMVGARISSGMVRGRKVAQDHPWITVRDVTHLGRFAPIDTESFNVNAFVVKTKVDLRLKGLIP
jgi:hypothetical protein